MDAFGEICIAVLVGIIVCLSLFSCVGSVANHQLPRSEWECTKAEVTEKGPPKVEECTQYSMEGTKP